MTGNAIIYIRKDGRFAARCDGTHDTGHFIAEDSGRFTVYEYDGGHTLCRNVTREEAEACIAHDWRHP
jgi:hypothetical protein